MQSIAPLTIEDFNKGAITVISEVKIDSDGAGTFKELPDIKTYNISTNEENRVARFCSHSFNITCLNTDNRYGPLNSGSDYYGWLKQGRKIKLSAGIAGKDPFQLILGRVDDFKLGKKAGQEICTITGRCLMRMVLDFKLYFPNTYWGTSHIYNTVANKIRYDMEADCEGIYKVKLDSTNKDGSKLEEIYENTDWTYDWHFTPGKLVFTPRRIPDFAGINNLEVYYFQIQDVEKVVADILYYAGIFATTGDRDDWVANTDYVTPTTKEIKRVWFNAGTSALKAITLLSEVVQYRFYFDYAGNPIFKPKPTAGSPVNTISDYEAKVENVEGSVDETYTHIIVIGEERDRVLGDDETKPAVPDNLALTTGFGVETQAGLAYIEATWDANTESDFGHYELRIKKNADAYYTEVSTITNTYMFYGIESGVTYNVQVRAVDIYNNRSDWSPVENIVSATDSSTPAKITEEKATAILAGIKIEWTRSSEDNIAYYLVERQESSEDNGEWSSWSEKVRTDATMWLDLLLTYSNWYRYRITAYTVAGVAGVTSDFTTAVQPNQADKDDIVAHTITTLNLNVDEILGNEAFFGKITAQHLSVSYVIVGGAAGDVNAGVTTISGGKITANSITITQLNFTPVKSTDVIAKINASAEGIRIEADNIYISGSTTFASGYNPTGKIAAGGAAKDVNTHTTTISGGKITTYSIAANKISVTSLASIKAILGTVHAGTIYGTRFRVGAGTSEDIYFEDSGIRFYDVGNSYLRLYKPGYQDFNINLCPGLIALRTSAVKLLLGAGTREVRVYNTGQFGLETQYSAPTSNLFGGQLIFNMANARFAGHISWWGHWMLTSGW